MFMLLLVSMSSCSVVEWWMCSWCITASSPYGKVCRVFDGHGIHFMFSRACSSFTCILACFKCSFVNEKISSHASFIRGNISLHASSVREKISSHASPICEKISSHAPSFTKKSPRMHHLFAKKYPCMHCSFVRSWKNLLTCPLLIHPIHHCVTSHMYLYLQLIMMIRHQIHKSPNLPWCIVVHFWMQVTRREDKSKKMCKANFKLGCGL